LLGSAGRGELAAVFLWPTLLIYLCAFGLISAVTYFAAQPHSPPGVVAGSAFFCAGWQGILALVAGYALMPLLLYRQAPQVIADSTLYLLIVPVIILSQYTQGVLQGKLHFRAVNVLRAIVPIGYLLGTLALWRGDILTMRNIVLLHMALQLLVLLATCSMAGYLGCFISLAVDRGMVNRLLGYGGKVYAGEVTATANLRLDQIVLAALFPPRMLGLYVVAVSVASIPEMFASAVRTVSSSRIAGTAAAHDRRTKLIEAFRGYVVISLPGTAFMALMLPIVIPIVFGSEYGDSIVPAEILLVGSLLLGMRSVLAGGAQAFGDPWIGSKAEVYSFPLTLLLLILLIPTLGIVGAAIASVLAYGTQVLVVVSGLRRHNVGWRELAGVSGMPMAAAVVPEPEDAATATALAKGTLRGSTDEPLPRPPRPAEPGPAPLVTVLITAWNRPDELGFTLRELRKQSWENVELIVIDDASPQSLAPVVHELWPEAVFICNPENRGLIANRSTGMALAKGRYIVSLDDDSNFTDPADLENAVARFEAEPSLGIITFAVSVGQEMPENGRRDDPERYTFNFIGCAHMLRTTMARDLGGYQDWFHYCGEEHEYSMRALNRGWRILYYPSVLVRHRVSMLNRNSSKSYQYGLRNAMLTSLLHAPFPLVAAHIAWKSALGLWDGLRMGWPPATLRALLGFVSLAPTALRNREPLTPDAARRYNLLRSTVVTDTESLSFTRVGICRFARSFARTWIQGRRMAWKASRQ